MPAERRDKEINGSTYSILLPPPSKCMPLCSEVLVIIGPVLLSSAKSFDGLVAAVQQTAPDRVDDIMMRAIQISKLSFSDKPIFNQVEFDLHFDSHRKDLYQACLWALWECVRDFLPDWATSILNRIDLDELRKKAFESPTDGQ